MVQHPVMLGFANGLAIVIAARKTLRERYARAGCKQLLKSSAAACSTTETSGPHGARAVDQAMLSTMPPSTRSAAPVVALACWEAV